MIRWGFRGLCSDIEGCEEYDGDPDGKEAW